MRLSLEARQAAISTAVSRLLVQNNESEEQAFARTRAIHAQVERNLHIFLGAMLVLITAVGAYLINYNRRIFDQVQTLSERQSELAQQLISMQESTFRSISRELHDDFGQILTAVGAMLQRANRLAAPTRQCCARNFAKSMKSCSPLSRKYARSPKRFIGMKWLKSDIGIGDMVVTDAAIAAIADVVFGDEVLFVKVPARPVGEGVFARTAYRSFRHSKWLRKYTLTENVSNMKSSVVEYPLHVTVVMPLRDDWLSARELIRRLDVAVSSCSCHLEILLVDDGSTETCRPADFQHPFAIIKAIRKLRLRRNLGHQRAIAVGLAHIERTVSCDAVVIMDADGEDTADGALQLIRSYLDEQGVRAIFAERSRRTESFTFRLSYSAFKALHRALTGLSVRVGNFSILPAKYLRTLVVMPEMWNHYAAAVFRSSLPFTMIPIPRGHRIAGTLRMNFVSLVTHGLSAISVFGDVVGVRLLLAALVGSTFVALIIAAVIAIWLFTDRAIPGWAPYACGTLGIMFLQFLAAAISFTFGILSSRTNLGFLPARDYEFFIAERIDIYLCE